MSILEKAYKYRSWDHMAVWDLNIVNRLYDKALSDVSKNKEEHWVLVDALHSYRSTLRSCVAYSCAPWFDGRDFHGL